jgi:glycosyltransferase involved in cell wall biosynthesis
MAGIVSRTVLFVVNDAAFFLSHRLVVAEAARAAGFNVEIATGAGSATGKIRELGYTFHELPLSRSGLDPLAELTSLGAIYKLFREVRPDLVHLVTIKPVLYGGVAARLARVPSVVAAISGLGTIFLAKGGVAALRRMAVQAVYRFALGHRNIRIVFQNTSDRQTFQDFGIAKDRTVIITGSGVDLSLFPPVPEPPPPVVVTMASRLLRDKGVLEFVAAADMVKARLPDVQFLLAGDIDTGNPTSLSQKDCDTIAQKGSASLLGHRTDIAELFSASHIVVLPSYREGLPKVLMEAAAAGRAVVTTDVPGCRDAIEPGRTGLLVPVQQADALAEAIQALAADHGLRQAFGRAGRALAERKFDVRQVAAQHLEIYDELIREST